MLFNNDQPWLRISQPTSYHHSMLSILQPSCWCASHDKLVAIFFVQYTNEYIPLSFKPVPLTLHQPIHSTDGMRYVWFKLTVLAGHCVASVRSLSCSLRLGAWRPPRSPNSVMPGLN